MYLLASPVGARILAGHTKGVAQSGVNLDDIRSFPAPLPPVEEQSEIVRQIDRALASLSSVNAAWEQAFERLGVLDQATLAKAFRGELVPQDPNDEPASVLLERLRAEREAHAGSAPKRSRGPRPAA
jgi:type I restriction enzyme S subunit